MKTNRLMLMLLVFILMACNNEYSTPLEKNSPLASASERLWMVKTVSESSSTKASAPKDKTWWKGQIIKIKFLNGNTTIQNKIKEYADLWLNYANLSFEYVDSSEYADVKISFDYTDEWISWSTVGTDCKAIPQNEPSLNFAYLQNETDATLIKGEVLRAFGLVLGLTFEHQNPISGVKIKSPEILASQYGISIDKANQIYKQYTAKYTNYSTYDKSSVMILDIPRLALVDASQYTPANKTLSSNDQTFIAQLYPKVVTPFFAIITTRGLYFKGWLKVTYKGKVVAQANSTSWTTSLTAYPLRIRMGVGDTFKFDYELYLSRNAKDIITNGTLSSVVDPGLAVPVLYSGGVVVSNEANANLYLPDTQRLQVSIVDVY